MLRRILCFILIVGVCTTTVCAEDVQSDIATEAFGLLSEASNDIEAAPKIVEGKELQTGYAVPARGAKRSRSHRAAVPRPIHIRPTGICKALPRQARCFRMRITITA